MTPHPTFAKINEETNLYNKDIYWSNINQVAKSGTIAKDTNLYYVLSCMLKCDIHYLTC